VNSFEDERRAALMAVTERIRDEEYLHDDLRGCGSLTEAVEMVLSRAGMSSYIVAAPPYPRTASDDEEDLPDETAIGVVWNSDQIGEVGIPSRRSRTWLFEREEPTREGYWFGATMVKNMVASIAQGALSMNATLSAPTSDHSLDGYWLTQALCLRAWWDTRMAEGHTEESAQFLLSLTAHPTVLACVRFESGAPAHTRLTKT
jgi:hypothetical protein